MKKAYIEKYDFNNVALIESELKNLLDSKIESAEALEAWLLKQSQVFDAFHEGLVGHYFDFQCYIKSEELKDIVEQDQSMIRPLIKKYKNELNQKYMDSPFRSELDPEFYSYYQKRLVNAQSLFHQSNVALSVEEDHMVNHYFETTGALTAEWDGEEKSLSQIRVFFEDGDRERRKEAFHKTHGSYASVEKTLQDNMTDLLKLRQKKADNAGLANYRDYMFKQYERFDYTPEDCRELAESIRKYTVPLKEKMEREHQKVLGLETYRPYDIQASPKGQKPLRPFNTIDELTENVKTILNMVDPTFGNLLLEMDRKGLLDLESRKGKAPGGFCEPLPVSKLSLIFMDGTGTQWDVITLLHEMGHCVHHDLFMNIPLNTYQEVPMESAELASMSMELLTMEHWDIFYKNEQDLRRAKRDHLRGILHFLPFGVIIDQFQHWMYENPDHTVEERNKKFLALKESYDSKAIDWTGLEDIQSREWMEVLHVFEVPFYFIEYVIAQLGALQIYQDYKKQPEETLRRFKAALALGSSVPLAKVYETAGIRFDFSAEMVKDLMAFLEKEIDVLQSVQ